MTLSIEQIKKILADAPDGATHCCLYNGTNFQFRISGLNAEIWVGKWEEYEGCALPDLEECHLVDDLCTILEQHQEIERLLEHIATLKAENVHLRHITKSHDQVCKHLFESIHKRDELAEQVEQLQAEVKRLKENDNERD